MSFLLHIEVNRNKHMYEYRYLIHSEFRSIIKSREKLCLLKLPQFSRRPQQCTTFDV